MKDYERLKMMEYPAGIVDIVIDTDAATEVDDPFAIAYALCSKERINVKAVYAAPFAMNEKTQDPEVGMHMSYEVIDTIYRLLGLDSKEHIFRGSVGYLEDKETPRVSDAVKHLIKLSEGYGMERPLYVVAIGVGTNIASAILLCPAILEKIVIIWLAGNDFDESPNTYNIYQDILAAQIIFNSQAAFIHVPCNHVASHLLTGIPELEYCIGGKNELCDYLLKLVKNDSKNHFAWGKQIWDIAAIAYLIDPSFSKCEITHTPMITDNTTWSRDYSRHLIKNMKELDRDKIMRDMYLKFYD